MKRIIAITVLAGFLFAGCGDKGTDPPPTKSTDYIAYVSDLDNPLIFRINTNTFAADSFEIPVGMSPYFYIHPSGEFLCSNIDGIGSLKLDLANLDTSLFWPKKARVQFSPDGQFVALFDPQFKILRSSNMTVTYVSDSQIYPGVFSADAAYYFAPMYAGGTFGDVVQIRVDSGFMIRRKSFGALNISPMLVSSDGHYWVINDFSSGRDSIIVYDTQSDSVIFTHRQVPGYGDFVLTHNGRYLFFSNPGPYPSHGSPGEPYIYIYDVEARQLLPRVNATGIFGTDTAMYTPIIFDLDVTPDNKYLFATHMGVSGRYVVMSIPDFTIVHFGTVSRRFLYRLAIPSGIRR